MVVISIKPERDPKVGGIFGAIVGAIAASRIGTFAFNKISDACNFDIEEISCTECKKLFKRRKYKKDKKVICGRC